MYDQEDRPTFGHKVDRHSVVRCMHKIQKESRQFVNAYAATLSDGRDEEAELETNMNANKICLADPYSAQSGENGGQIALALRTADPYAPAIPMVSMT